MSDEPVDWALAERVGRSVAGRAVTPHVDLNRLSDEVNRFAPEAEALIAAETGLSPATPASVQVIDRGTWVQLNLQAFRTLLRPLLERHLGTQSRPAGAVGRAMIGAGRTTLAAELGGMLGWMSRRVLGQYDSLAGAGTGEAVYLVGVNLAVVEQTMRFVPLDFRRWVTLHELTHRAQFTAVPWMRDHYLGLVDEVLAADRLDPSAVVARLRSTLTDRAAAKQQIRDGGVAALMADEGQRAAMHRIAGLMSLLEGHGNHVMNRAGVAVIPDVDRFHRTLEERRANVNPIQRLVMQVLGLQAKLDQYAAGERFIEALEAASPADRLIDRCWADQTGLPDLDEIRDPSKWLARMAIDTGR